MKSYKHLWSQFISDENITIAYKEYLRGRTKDVRTRTLYKRDPKRAIEKARKYAYARKKENHKSKIIIDGSSRKVRTIIRPMCEEQILHHMAINVLKPIFMRPMYKHSHGSIPERGCLSGRKTLAKWIKYDRENTKYFLKMDIKKYFESIPHDILKVKLDRIIKDKQLLPLLHDFVDVKCDGVINKDKGIPLGFYPSQWFANFYLTDLDHYIKEKLHAKYYMRYMDDMIVFDKDKNKLESIRLEIAKYVNDNLGLTLKDNWRICELGEDNGHSLDFMGFRFYTNRVGLRKSLLYRLSRKARQIHKKGATIYTARQFLSLAGWTKHADVYNSYKLWVKPYCSKRAMRLYVSKFDKRRGHVETSTI